MMISNILKNIVQFCRTRTIPNYLSKQTILLNQPQKKKTEAVVEAAQNWHITNFMKNNTAKTETMAINPTEDQCEIVLKTGENDEEIVLNQTQKRN